MRAAVAIGLLILLGQIHATAFADELKVGDLVRDKIALGNGTARREFLLPVGEWRVLRVRNMDGRRTAQIDQLDPPRFVDVVLAHLEGRNLVMLMRVLTLREPTTIRRWSLQDEPCRRADVLYRNTYDSTVWTSKCLQVDHVAGFLTTTMTAYSEVRKWMAAGEVKVPATSLHGFFARFRDYHNFAVHVWTNPDLRKLDSQERAWAANPYHRDWQAKEPERKHYVDEFVAWSENYMAYLLRDSAAPEKHSIAVFR